MYKEICDRRRSVISIALNQQYQTRTRGINETVSRSILPTPPHHPYAYYVSISQSLFLLLQFILYWIITGSGYIISTYIGRLGHCPNGPCFTSNEYHRFVEFIFLSPNYEPKLPHQKWLSCMSHRYSYQQFVLFLPFWKCFVLFFCQQQSKFHSKAFTMDGFH